MKNEDKMMFMGFAEAAARRSHAVRLKVGCILVKDGEVLSTGLNGMPPKWPTEVCEDTIYADEEVFWLFDGSQEVDGNVSDKILVKYPQEVNLRRYRLVTKPECRHAEIAALEKMWKSHNTTKGAECFVTTAPCSNCSIKLLTAGIKKVYYRHNYRSTEGLEYLITNGVQVEQI